MFVVIPINLIEMEMELMKQPGWIMKIMDWSAIKACPNLYNIIQGHEGKTLRIRQTAPKPQ